MLENNKKEEITMNTKIKKYNRYKLPMIILLLTIMCVLISVFINLPFTPFAGSIILAGTTLTCLMYNIEENRFKSKQIENNVKQLIYGEVYKSIEILGPLLLTENREIPKYLIDSMCKNNIVMWYKLILYLPQVFKEEELCILQDFFIDLEKLDQVTEKWGNKCLDNTDVRLIKDIQSKGKYVLKKVFAEKYLEETT